MFQQRPLPLNDFRVSVVKLLDMLMNAGRFSNYWSKSESPELMLFTCLLDRRAWHPTAIARDPDRRGTFPQAVEQE